MSNPENDDEGRHRNMIAKHRLVADGRGKAIEQLQRQLDEVEALADEWCNCRDVVAVAYGHTLRRKLADARRRFPQWGK
jgi:hypothetical protein